MLIVLRKPEPGQILSTFSLRGGAGEGERRRGSGQAEEEEARTTFDTLLWDEADRVVDCM